MQNLQIDGKRLWDLLMSIAGSAPRRRAACGG